jgi:hypothetical protein
MTRPLTKSRRRTAGASSLEALVAFTLFTTTLAAFVPLVVRHNRLLAAQREYRLALDELSNQLERLRALPRQQLPQELEELRPSEYAAARLPGASLRGELAAADLGERLQLRLVWDEPQRRMAPVTLATWIYPDPRSPIAPSPEGESR